MKKEEVTPESYAEMQKKYKKLKEECSGTNNEMLQNHRLTYYRKMREKRAQEKWMKALMHFGGPRNVVLLLKIPKPRLLFYFFESQILTKLY
jgi:hypothetical protein